MNIALDFDGTYTEDTTLWNRFIKEAQRRNHRVFLVTFRAPEHESLNQDMFDYLKSMKVPLIFTNRVPKRAFTESMGLSIDIWIDDNPDLIIQASEWSKEDYDKWAQGEAKRAKEAMAAQKKAATKEKKETKDQTIARWTQEYLALGQNHNVASALAHHRWANQESGYNTAATASAPQPGHIYTIDNWAIHDEESELVVYPTEVTNGQ